MKLPTQTVRYAMSLSLFLMVQVPLASFATSENGQAEEAVIFQGKQLRVSRGRHGIPESVDGELGFINADRGGIEVRELLLELRPIFRGGLDESFDLVRTDTFDDRRLYVLRQQNFGIPIISGSTVVHVNPIDGQAYRVTGAFMPAQDLPRKPQLSSANAETLIVGFLVEFLDDLASEIQLLQTPTLVYSHDVAGYSHLACGVAPISTGHQADR